MTEDQDEPMNWSGQTAQAFTFASFYLTHAELMLALEWIGPHSEHSKPPPECLS